MTTRKRKKTPAYRRPNQGNRKKLNAAVEAEGDAAVFEHVAAGKTMREVAAIFGLDRDTLYKWIHEGGEGREAAWREAKRRSADALAEQGMQILDDAADEVETSAQASVARSRANYRQWLAGTRNRDEYGAAGAAVTVNVGIGELHLDALRQRGMMELPQGEGPEVLEAEVVEEGEGDEDVLALLR